ncbi:MAG: hypothetical protein ACRDG3_09585 [Tepidiformaceae bacterium]
MCALLPGSRKINVAVTNMTIDKTLLPELDVSPEPPASLTERESQLLRQAGERVFGLARKVAAAERRETDLKRELDRNNELLEEVRRTRDVLSAQVNSLLRERERDYEERSELRQLLGAITVQLQTAMNRPNSPEFEPGHPPTRHTPEVARAQRPTRISRPTRTTSDSLGSLVGAARKGWARLGKG